MTKIKILRDGTSNVNIFETIGPHCPFPNKVKLDILFYIIYNFRLKFYFWLILKKNLKLKF